MTLQDLNNLIDTGHREIITTEYNGDELAFEIDDSTIFKDLKYCEFFEFRSSKIFTRSVSFKLYQKYVLNKMLGNS